MKLYSYFDGRFDVANIFKSINSLLIFSFISFLIVGEVSIITSLMLVVSICMIPYTKIKELERVDIFLIAIFVLYGYYHAVHEFYSYGFLWHSGVEKYLKFLGCALFFIGLKKFGYYRWALVYGLILGSVLLIIFSFNEVMVQPGQRLNLGHNPIYFGIMVIVYNVFLLYIFNTDSGLKKFSSMVLAIFCFYISTYSGSRLLYLLYPIVAIYFLYSLICFFRKNEYVNVKYVVYCLFVFGGALMLYFSNTVNERVERSFVEISSIIDGDLNNSFGHRVQMWHSGIYLFSKKPIFGAGSDREVLNYELKEFSMDRNYMDGLMIRYSQFHNAYIDEMAKYGLIGLFLYVMLMLASSIGLSGEKYKLLMVLSLVYLVASIGETPFSQNRVMICFLLFVIMARCCVQRDPEDLNFKQSDMHES